MAAKLEGIARGLILKGRSGHETRRLASTDLQRLSVAAGVTLPKAQLAHLCALTGAWVQHFAEMTVARDYLSDHKRYSDNHEARVLLELTRFPMEVLMGDVHKMDMSVAEALKSHDPREWIMAQDTKKNGRETICGAIIAWMDGSSHFMWATPVTPLGRGKASRNRAWRGRFPV